MERKTYILTNNSDGNDEIELESNNLLEALEEALEILNYSVLEIEE